MVNTNEGEKMSMVIDDSMGRRTLARMAMDDWDGCGTADLIMNTIQILGEDPEEVLSDVNHKLGRPLQLQSFLREGHHLTRRVAELNRLYPVGTVCRFWAGSTDGPFRESCIRSKWSLAPAGDIVAFVDGYAGWIAATHIECELEPGLWVRGVTQT